MRWRAFVDLIHTHRWHSAVIGFLLLFVGGLVGGYWIAGRMDGSDRDKIARDALEDMKRNEQVATPRQSYARIEDIPGLPRYTETEPGQQMRDLEEKPRAGTCRGWRQRRPEQTLAAQRAAVPRSQQQAADRDRDRRRRPRPAALEARLGTAGTADHVVPAYAKDLREQAKAARAHGQEVMLHLPMEPVAVPIPAPTRCW